MCFGSFANALIYRLPRKISVFAKRSACPSCGSNISFLDLLPVVSWVFLKGRCRHCLAGISVRYPLIELACAFLFASTILITNNISAIFICLLVFALLTISVIDADTQEIPNELLVFIAIVGVSWVVLGRLFPIFSCAPGIINAVMGILVGGLPLLLIDKLTLVLVKKDGFGYGDVKLMAVCGIFLGWQLSLIAFLIAFVVGGIYATYLLATHRVKRGEYIAFGPFLCVGVVASIWVGQEIISFIL